MSKKDSYPNTTSCIRNNQKEIWRTGKESLRAYFTGHSHFGKIKLTKNNYDHLKPEIPIVTYAHTISKSNSTEMIRRLAQ